MKSKYSGKCRRCQTPFGVGTEIISDGGGWYLVDCEGCTKRDSDLMSLLSHAHSVGMGTHKHMLIECISGYERGGKHDYPGVDWIATIHDIPHHWMSTKGWQKGTTDSPISFKGKSLMDVVSRAHSFLMWYNENKNKEQQHEV